MRVIERLRGQGTLRRKDTGASIKVRYAVDILQEEVNVGHGETIDGLLDSRGSVETDEFIPDWVGKDATLLFPDGRCLDGFIRNSDGAFCGSGPLYRSA
jgi:hypothetical protein